MDDASKTLEFKHLGIRKTKKNDASKVLEERLSTRVDPYKQGLHLAKSMDMDSVRLCFQAFLEDPENPGKFNRVVLPVCSEPIFDKKAKKELQIIDISDVTAPAEGGKKIIILCEKISKKDDINVKFFHDNWEAYGDFRSDDVRFQHAISLKTPPYLTPNLSEPKQCWVQLTTKDGSTSDPVQFTFTPQTYAAVLSTFESRIIDLEMKPMNVYNGGIVTIVQQETEDVKVEQQESAASAAERSRGSEVGKTNCNEVLCTNPTVMSRVSQFNQTSHQTKYIPGGPVGGPEGNPNGPEQSRDTVGAPAGRPGLPVLLQGDVRREQASGRHKQAVGRPKGGPKQTVS